MTAIRFPQPTSVDGIKRLARRLKAQDHIPHSKALDAAARHAGFSNFIDAKRRIEKAAPARGRASVSKMPKGQSMPLEEFHQRARAQWDRAVASITTADDPPTKVWRGVRDIANALEPFMGEGRNHAHLPTGGGQDFASVRPSAEPGCLEFRVGRRTGYIVKPKSLTLERIASPGNSFLFLKLDELPPSGIYHVEPDDDDDHEEINRQRLDRGSEELLELTPGQYDDRSLWDRGFFGYDEDGHEQPFPDSARIVVRFFRGSILFVSKGSLWNGSPRTYDGEHDRLTPDLIRATIESALERIEA